MTIKTKNSKKEEDIQQEFNPLSFDQTKKKGGATRITIKYDVGFANQLFIRGEGAGLSWDKGSPLKNVKADEWVWETTNPFTEAKFKVLVNDKAYEKGENHSLRCGASLSYTPQF